MTATSPEAEERLSDFLEKRAAKVARPGGMKDERDRKRLVRRRSIWAS